jgi:hypothetical protein
MVSKDFKKRLFLTPESILYKCLSGNYDVTEDISKRITTMNQSHVIKSIQLEGRAYNRELRKTSILVFKTIGWDQESFDIGAEWVLVTCYDSISEEQKTWYVSVVEEAFFTMNNKEA